MSTLKQDEDTRLKLDDEFRPDDDLRQEYLSRTEGLVSPAAHAKVVVCVGCGAGSYLYEKLARCASPAEIRLVDFDHVEWANLCRTAYGASDVGKKKVDALAARLTDANPFVRAVPYCADICAMSDAETNALCAGADLLIAGTDSFPAQAKVNTLSQRLGIPAAFIGIHAAAEGGRVIWSVPQSASLSGTAATPCYRCVASERYRLFKEAGTAQVDLPGARGLLPDVQFIDSVALKVSLALLDRGQQSAMGRFYDAMRGRTEIVLRCTPEYLYGAQLWDALLSDLPTEPKLYAKEIMEEVLFAMDTIWLTTERSLNCPDCGDHKVTII